MKTPRQILSELRTLARQSAPALEAQFAAQLAAANIQPRRERAALLAALGLFRIEEGQPAAGLHLLEQSLQEHPPQPGALLNLSIALFRLGRLGESISRCEQALAYRPDYPRALLHRATLARATGNPHAARDSLARASACAPGDYRVAAARGDACRTQGDFTGALTAYNHALRLNPGFPPLYNTRAKTHKSLGQWTEALLDYETALALDPGYAKAHLNRAHLLMLTGRFRDGLLEYEWRWRIGSRPPALTAPLPRWAGGALPPGTRLWIWHEQGLGDSIQYARYIPRLAAQGIQVLLEAPAPLLPLYAGLPGAASILPKGSPQPPCDRHIPLLSIPLALGDPAPMIPHAPYLSADPARLRHWHDQLGPPTRRRVGLAWAGSPTHANDRARSLQLVQLTPLLQLPCDFHALQPTLRDQDRAAFTDSGIHDHRAQLTDFAETAALVALMDLVITVDTAIAHLAGALGKPVWILLPGVPDHRWGLHTPDTPWYPSARLFRQTLPGNWGPVLQTITRQLAD